MKGARYCGLDFGTTNSTVGVVYDGHCSLVDLSDVHAATFPSAIFFDFDRDAVSYGHEAIDSYLAGHRGRIMWAPKNILGSSLMDDSTDVGTIKLSFFSIISLLIANLKERAEERSNTELRQVVLGRPVHYNDSDAAFDTRSEHFMRNIAQSVGFEDIAFEYEPIAAAVTYEQTIHAEQTALIVDMGGGTSDFSVIRVSPASRSKTDRRDDILAIGGIHVAGTDFDRELSLRIAMPHLGLGCKYRSSEGKHVELPLAVYYDLASWHRIQFAYNDRVRNSLVQVARSSEAPERIERLISVIDNLIGHYLAKEIELTKIRLGQDVAVSTRFKTPMSPERWAELNRPIDACALANLVEARAERRRHARETCTVAGHTTASLDKLPNEVDLHNALSAIEPYEAKERAILTRRDKARSDLDALRTASDHLMLEASRVVFDECISGLLGQIEAKFRSVIAEAGLRAEHIDVAFLTGGSSLLPSVRKRLRSALPSTRFVDGDVFGSVGMGLTVLSKQIFGGAD